MPSTSAPDEAGQVSLDDTGDQDRPRIAVSGCLDARLGRALTTLYGTVLDRAPLGIALDLTRISRASRDGIDALVSCLAAGRGLDDGVDIAVASPAGRRVLLDTLAEV